MTKLIAVKCPQCGADLEIEDGRKTAYCTYCGAKILIENENEYIYRHIDEAEIKKAETDEKVKMRSLDLDEKEGKADRILTFLWIGSLLFLVLFGVFNMNDGATGIWCFNFAMIDGMFGIFFRSQRQASLKERQEARSGKIKLSSSAFSRKNVHSVEHMLRSMGFINIELLNLKDLTAGWIYKPGMVESVTIGGNPAEEGKWYYHDDPIIITYHDFGS